MYNLSIKYGEIFNSVISRLSINCDNLRQYCSVLIQIVKVVQKVHIYLSTNEIMKYTKRRQFI